MKNINEYQYSAVITLSPMRYCSILRVTISLKECEKKGYVELFNKLLIKLRDLDFSISEFKSEANYTEFNNIIEFNIEPYIKIVDLAKDLEEELVQYFDSVLNQVRIKGK